MSNDIVFKNKNLINCMVKVLSSSKWEEDVYDYVSVKGVNIMGFPGRLSFSVPSKDIVTYMDGKEKNIIVMGIPLNCIKVKADMYDIGKDTSNALRYNLKRFFNRYCGEKIEMEVSDINRFADQNLDYIRRSDVYQIVKNAFDSVSDMNTDFFIGEKNYKGYKRRDVLPIINLDVTEGYYWFIEGKNTNDYRRNHAIRYLGRSNIMEDAETASSNNCMPWGLVDYSFTIDNDKFIFMGSVAGI